MTLSSARDNDYHQNDKNFLGSQFSMPSMLCSWRPLFATTGEESSQPSPNIRDIACTWLGLRIITNPKLWEFNFMRTLHSELVWDETVLTISSFPRYQDNHTWWLCPTLPSPRDLCILSSTRLQKATTSPLRAETAAPRRPSITLPPAPTNVNFQSVCTMSECIRRLGCPEGELSKVGVGSVPHDRRDRSTFEPFATLYD